ncbi:MAG: hypothetical protein II534_03555, partial [Clostridia bacterium]|nr:hypothetical protein [Clostridia bacterium]
KWLSGIISDLSSHPVLSLNVLPVKKRIINNLRLLYGFNTDLSLYCLAINTTVSTCLGAAGQIKRLVFDPLVHPNEGMGNFPVSVRVETVG